MERNGYSSIRTPIAWNSIVPPSINDIQPGGTYQQGIIQYGPLEIDVYVPPTVWYYPTSLSHHPRYQKSAQASIVPSGSYVADYWYGEDVGNVGQDPVLAGSWTRVHTRQNTQLPNAKEGLVGFFAGLGDAPESLPPGVETEQFAVTGRSFSPPVTGAELGGDLAVTTAYALNSALAMGHENTFVIQRNHHGQFRIIIVTNVIKSPSYQYYANAGRPVPIVWGPETMSRWP